MNSHYGVSDSLEDNWSRLMTPSEELPQELLDLVPGLEAADALDLPIQANAGIFEHARPHRLAQVFEVVASCVSGVDHKVAVHRRHLCAADHQTAAACLIDFLPRRGPFRVLEG